MAKGSNPVDAHRKAQRKAELKKNKAKREQQREVSTVKTDTRPIEAELRQLNQKAQQGPLSKADKDELARLRADLARITKAKQEYVEKHPEHRKFVFPERAPSPSELASASDEPAGLYDRNGRLKHPERSIYFDPVFNPYGAPPPGMPYREKPEYAMARFGGPTPEEMAAFQPVVQPASGDEDSSDDDEDEDDDIVMPAGPPPTSAPAEDDSSDDSDDSMDIPLPPGPPPPRPGTEPVKTTSRIAIPRPSRPAASSFFPPPHPHPHSLPPRPSFQPPQPPPQHPRPHQPHNPRLPARPPPAAAHMSDPLNAGGAPARAFQEGHAPPAPIGPVQPFPAATAATAPVQQAGPSPFLPLPGGAAAAAASGATISAAPQLRDLKKEATAFVPAAMRRKLAAQKATLAKAGLTSVDAARGGETQEGGGERKKTLVEEMRERGIGAPAGGAQGREERKDEGKEDYERFRAEMGEFL
ncbi:hypothetical protein JCM10450v2_002390 [Rhodotorula kratochvilovae]